MTFFGHPLHPMTVHFPIAFYLLGILLTAGYLWQGRTEYDRFAYWCFLLSSLGVLVTSLTGLVDQNRLELTDPRRDLVDDHITAAVALLIINGLIIYLRLRRADILNSPQRWIYMGLLAAGTAALLVTAWLGAELVYRLQVGVQPR